MLGLGQSVCFCSAWLQDFGTSSPPILSAQIYIPAGSFTIKNLIYTPYFNCCFTEIFLLYFFPFPPKKKSPNQKTNSQTKPTIQPGHDLTWQSKCWQWRVLSGCCQLRTGSQPTFFLLHEDLTVTPSAGPHGTRAET